MGNNMKFFIFWGGEWIILSIVSIPNVSASTYHFAP